MKVSGKGLSFSVGKMTPKRMTSLDFAGKTRETNFFSYAVIDLAKYNHMV